jgi:thioredoxin 1
MEFLMRPLLTVLLLLLTFAASLAFGAPRQAYDEQAFKVAQAAGKPVMVEIHADWCGECKMQDRILARLAEEPAYAGLVRLRVNYDKQKDLVRAFGAKRQSTLVLFRYGNEVGRVVATTNEKDIKALLAKAW